MNYLDIATGTGQLMFKVLPSVKERVFGNDLSETQLEVCQKKVD